MAGTPHEAQAAAAAAAVQRLQSMTVKGAPHDAQDAAAAAD